jgi:dynein intermediate chain, cytosolic
MSTLPSHRPLTPRFVPDLIDIEQELFELPQKERVLYNKEIQTADVESDSSTEDEDGVRQRQAKERERELEIEIERVRERELEEESLQLDREIEEAIRGWCSSVARI